MQGLDCMKVDLIRFKTQTEEERKLKLHDMMKQLMVHFPITEVVLKL